MSKQPARICTSLVIFALFSGCAASTQNSPGTSSHVAISPTQIIHPPLTSGPGQATIIVKRDPGFFGSGLDATLTVDGTDTARLKAGQYYQFRIAPGEHLFGVRPTEGLGKLLADVHREVAVTAVAGRTYVLRLLAERGSGMHIQRSSL